MTTLKASNTLRERKFVVTSGNIITQTFDSGTVTYSFPTNVKSFKVINYCIPFGWYPVNARNNTITFAEDGGADTTATLTPGNYTVSQLLTEIKTQMEAESANARTYTITSNTNTEKITIAVGAGDVNLRWTQNPLTNAALLLGFNYTDTGDGSTHTGNSSNKIVQGTDSNIIITTGSTGNIVSQGGGIYHDRATTTFGVIAEVPITGNYGTFLTPSSGFLGQNYPLIPASNSFFSSSLTTTFHLRFPRKKVTISGTDFEETEPPLISTNQRPWMMVLSGTLGS